jgi:hypothetical protein
MLNMDAARCHAAVGETLTLLVDGLAPFVEKVFSTKLPPQIGWPTVLERKDNLAGRRGGIYSSRDLSLLLRVLTERLGELGYPFDGELPRQGQAYASELREVRNSWAHNQLFTAQSAYRAADSAALLLRMVDGHVQADLVDALKLRLLPVRLAPDSAGNDLPAPDLSELTELAAEPTADPIRADESSASIAIKSVPFLSYAMAHCSVPVVDEIVIENFVGELRGASVEVDVVSATGSLGGPKVLMVDLGDRQTTTLRSIDLLLDPASMLGIEEQRPGIIRATLRDALGNLVSEATVQVQILAFNQWIASPLNLGLELLAAHVQPNAAVISPLLLEASDLLKVRTGDSSLSGYQSENPARVDETVEAIYDAMRARDIRYAEPPASWGSRGQKVRTPAEVLDGRLGTCLDTTVTLASALEQAGINSTLWLLEGHIFLGYWRVDSTLESVAHTDVGEVVNRVDLGLIALVETTSLTGGDSASTFAEARRTPHARQLSGDLGQFLGITDIHEARKSGIFPLPSRSLDAQGGVTVTVYEPGASPVIAPYLSTPGESSSVEAGSVPPRVTAWKNSLLDLSLRNRLINYTDRAGHRLAVPAPAVGRMEDTVSAGAPIMLLPSDAVPTIDRARGIQFGRDLPESARELLLAEKKAVFIDVTEAAYTTKLRYLANKARTIVEETGANNLYLAFGMLHWTVNDRELKSPLVLVPVNITTASRGSSYRITLDESGESTPNYCLLEKLRVSFGLHIPGLSMPTEDASGIDLPAAFRAVREAVDQAGLPFRVEESADLSILQFAKFRLWKDLDENWEALSANSLVSHLINSPLEPFSDPVADAPNVDLDELGASVPVPADSSQLEAVAEAVGGRTFVLEGPPGTGKSQTITNLLARSLADGKRVLFVAEKRAALDVVKKRLESVGLGNFSLDLHDKGARPAAVRAQIKAALDLHLQTDSAALHANMEAARSSTSSLTRYASRLHSTNAAGLSLYSALAQVLAADPDVEALPIPAALVAEGDTNALAALRSLFRQLPEMTDLARPHSQHPWAFIDDVSDSQPDAAAIYAAARDFDDALEAIQAIGFDLTDLNRMRTPQMVTNWQQLAEAPRYPLPHIDNLQSTAWQSYLKAFRSDVAATARAVPEWTDTVSVAVLQKDIPAIHDAALAADAAGYFGRKKKRRAVLNSITPDLKVDPSSVPLKSLSTLTASLVISNSAATALRSSGAQIPLQVMDEQWNPFIPEHAERLEKNLAWVNWVGAALAEDQGEDRSGLRRYYSATEVGHGHAELRPLAETWERLIAATTAKSGHSGTWAGDEGWIAQWWSSRQARNLHAVNPYTLEHWINLVRLIEPLRTVGMTQTRDAILRGEVHADDATLAYDKGVAVASVDERQQASALADFDTTAHNKTITRFITSTQAVRSELPRAIPVGVLGLRRFDTNVASGLVGGLRRQLDRQRGGMSVRVLLENYGELITQIMPCTLMSPESVARFFPANPDLFDIVVFDEASQIRVADAVGAMGRASSVVVVGDSKQMPPTSFAEVSSSADEDAEMVAETVVDEESILSECVQARVPSKWLSWHYRSQDEALIAFSNYHYYDNRLSSFPAPGGSVSQDGHGVSMVLVEGHFNRSGRGKSLRTNEVEADAIVADIRHRFAASHTVSPSVGVVTFNVQQRALIENMLRDSPDVRIAAALDESDGLFVKNLENVQGDERDTILFSIAFSANDRGAVPLNFGPLSRAGGERRLNVAITRARRQVVLYASFEPSALRAQDTSSVGIKHLKSYLEMASRASEEINETLPRRSVVDRHCEDIAAALRSLGFVVHTDVGLSDFRVDISIAISAAPKQPLVAVLLDGPNWRARRTVSDRDGLPVDVLQNLMRWPGVERVWLPEWLHDREGTLARLRNAVETAASLDDSSSAVEQSRLATEPRPEQPPISIIAAGSTTEVPRHRELNAVRSSTQPQGFQTRPTLPARRQNPLLVEFAEWSPGILGPISVLDDLPRHAATLKVQNAIRAAVATEGPIHSARLVRAVAAAFSLDRVNQARASGILRCAPPELQRSAGEAFFWPSDTDPTQWNVARQSSGGTSRPIEHVPLEEIANAMRIVTEAAAGMDETELKREALALFGGRRITEAIGSRLDAALSLGLTSGRLGLTSLGVWVTGQATG